MVTAVACNFQPFEDYWSKELVQQGLKRQELIQVVMYMLHTICVCLSKPILRFSSCLATLQF